MPYIIETQRRIGAASCHELGVQPIYEPVSRVAVATLEEARDHMAAEIGTRHEQEATITEAGGTIGPLPDGTIIEVQRVGWNQLVAEPHYYTDRQMIAVFNAT